jgi:hypothetical protein
MKNICLISLKINYFNIAVLRTCDQTKAYSGAIDITVLRTLGYCVGPAFL